MTTGARYVIRRPLTGEIADPRSPIRGFLDGRFSCGLREVQRRFREPAPRLVVPPGEANPPTVGTAADWLLRFLAHPQPNLDLAVIGAVACEQAGIQILPALAGIADVLEVPLPRKPSQPRPFTGPVRGSAVDPELLARSCWALALLTEAYRAGPAFAATGPLGQFRHAPASTDDLLGLAAGDALRQLAQFRDVFETALLPRLAAKTGRWVLGPMFAGSELVKADADLIAAGLLLELKTSAKLSLPRADMFQVIGYVLLDFDDAYRLDALAVFSARYGHLATWDLEGLLSELAGRQLSLPNVRAEFRQLLLTQQAGLA